MRLLPDSPRLFLMCVSFSCLSILLMLPTDWTLGFIQDQYRTVTGGNKSVGTNRFCQLKHNIVYLKVHKTGGTTILNTLQRFGHSRGLTFVLPKIGNYLGVSTTLDLNNILPLKPNDTYNILGNHVVYNRKAFHSILTRPMFYFATLRSPFDQFVSAVYFFNSREKYLMNVGGEHPISEYLKDPRKYEALLKDPRLSYTNNRMAFDLGLELSDVRNETKISEYINILDEDVHYIMIMEYFDVSMVLLKRLLCWELKDILYMRKHINSKKGLYKPSVDDYKRHREWAKADYMIYEHFLEVFWKKVQNEGPGLALEVDHYRSIRTLAISFCTSHNQDLILIPKSRWNDEFEVTSKDCKMIIMDTIPFVHMLQKEHKRQIHY